MEHEKIAQHDGNNNVGIVLLLGCYKVARQKVTFAVEFMFVEIDHVTLLMVPVLLSDAVILNLCNSLADPVAGYTKISLVTREIINRNSNSLLNLLS